MTGNHYWLDAIVATALLGVVAAVLNYKATVSKAPAIPKPRINQI